MQPIKNQDTIYDMECALAKLEDTHGRRMFLLFEVGLRMGFRISDMVGLKVGDLRGKKEYSYMPKKQENKAKRKREAKITLPVDPDLRRILADRCADMADEDWLFPSRTRTRAGNVKHITRQTAYHDMKRIGEVTGYPEPLGCHSLRKTFGYQYYRKNQDIAILQKWFYHESAATTMIYIGITLDDFRKMVSNSPFSKASDLPL